MKKELEFLMTKLEKTSDRYVQAERKLIEIMEMPWWKRIFIGNSIGEFLKSRYKIYGF